MRELTAEEAKTLFEKMARYIGSNVEKLINRPDGDYVLRVIKDRVYYMSDVIEKQCHNISRKQLIGAGILLGKFTHHKRFHLKITSLPLLSSLAVHKVWISPSAEISFLYKNDIIRSQILRMSENMPENVGVVIYSPDDQAIGFGVLTKASVDAARSDPASKIVIHQGDVGEYLRDQDEIF